MSGRDARALLRAMRCLEADGLVIGTVGNGSVRIPGGCRITPTRMPYRRMRPRHLVTVADDASVRGGGRPSSELLLHLAVYAARPDVGAVLHTHSPEATAWSFLDRPLQPEVEEVRYYAVGGIRTAPAAPAGGRDLALEAVTALGSSGAVLLGRHGVLVVGADVAAAAVTARVVEHQARIAWRVRQAGQAAASTASGPQRSMSQASSSRSA